MDIKAKRHGLFEKALLIEILIFRKKLLLETSIGKFIPEDISGYLDDLWLP